MNFNRDDNTPIRFNPGRKDSFSADNSEVGTRPAGDPKSAKNFQKILSKDEEPKETDKDAAIDADEETEGAIALVEEKILKAKSLKKAPPLSLFELSSSAARNAPAAEKFKPDTGALSGVEANEANVPIAPKEHLAKKVTETPADLYAKLTAREGKAVDNPNDSLLANAGPAPINEKKDKFNPHFATEQADLSYVNPLALNTQPLPSIAVATDKPVLPAVHVQAIIDQLVEKIVQMETGDRTDTVITLKRPPILAGADLIVTGFNSAKGEFNITFQKLTQAAKDLLDMRANQQSLLLALEQKGYAVHIVTTTTLAEIKLPTAEPSAEQRNSNQGREQEQRQNKEKDEER